MSLCISGGEKSERSERNKESEKSEKSEKSEEWWLGVLTYSFSLLWFNQG